jgi:hypothetical protein
MSVEAIPGGKRCIDRVLDPRLVAGVEGLELEELRARRGGAGAEEQSISYLRRCRNGTASVAQLLE